MHALIIEDDPLLAVNLQILLEDLGASSTITVASQAAAVSRARQFPPNLIIADVHLQDGLGIAAVQAIRSSAGTIPVVYVTGDPETAKRLDPDALVLSKPLKDDELVSAIMRLRPFFRNYS